MKREEAIMWLNAERKARCKFGVLGEGSLLVEAFDMAIEALHREEAEAKGYCHRINPKNDCNCDERREPLNGKSADIVIIDERREPENG